jgi:hypothetical protein
MNNVESIAVGLVCLVGLFMVVFMVRSHYE